MENNEKLRLALDEYFETFPDDTDDTIALSIEALIEDKDLTKEFISTPISNLLALQKLIKKLHEQRISNDQEEEG